MTPMSQFDAEALVNAYKQVAVWTDTITAFKRTCSLNPLVELVPRLNGGYHTSIWMPKELVIVAYTEKLNSWKERVRELGGNVA